MPSAQALLKGEPHSVDAERTVIGALLLDPDRIVDVVATIQPQDFYDPTLRAIYEAIRRLYEDRTPIDFVTVSDALRGDEKLQSIGGSAFLATLATNVPTSAHAVHYADIVRDKAIHRQLLDAGDLIAKLARSEKLSATEALELAEQKLLSITRNIKDSKP